MLRILHSSDLHGDYKALLDSDIDFDIWLDTGDFFDNLGRVSKTGFKIIPELEMDYQAKWWHRANLGERFAKWLNGRPVISVSGNHDFLSLHSFLKIACTDTHLITPNGTSLSGLRWAGFREITYLNGEWAGEIQPQDFDKIVECTFAYNPDILVTHSQPDGIFTGMSILDFGVTSLTRHLSFKEHSVRWHFFGHDHFNGGMQIECMNVRFCNGAKNVILHEIEP